MAHRHAQFGQQSRRGKHVLASINSIEVLFPDPDRLRFNRRRHGEATHGVTTWAHNGDSQQHDDHERHLTLTLQIAPSKPSACAMVSSWRTQNFAP